MKKMNVNFILFFLIFGALFMGCPDGKVEPTPQPLEFGEVYVGDSLTRTAKWINRSNAGVSFAGFAIEPAPVFSTTDTIAGTTGDFVDADDYSKDYHFTFAPTNAGETSGTVQVFTYSGSIKKLNMKGTGIFQKRCNAFILEGGDLVQNQPLNFGNVGVGHSKTLTFMLRNAGPSPLTVRASVKQGSNGFTISVPAAGDIALPVAASVPVVISFNPAAVGEKFDAIEFVDTVTATNIAGTVVKGKGVQEQ